MTSQIQFLLKIRPRLLTSSQTIGLSPQAFLSNPWFNDAIFACLHYNIHEPCKPIKFHPSKIYSENPKRLNQSFNAFQMLFRKTDQNGSALGKYLTSILS